MSFFSRSLSSLLGASTSDLKTEELDTDESEQEAVIVTCKDELKDDVFPDSIEEPSEHNLVLTLDDVAVAGQLSLLFQKEMLAISSLETHTASASAEDSPLDSAKPAIEDCKEEMEECKEEHSGEDLSGEDHSVEAVACKCTSQSVLTHGPDLILRFTIGYGHMKNMRERMEHTTSTLRMYFKAFEEADFLSLARLRGDELTAAEKRVRSAVVYFCFGVDKCGHPTLYDRLGATDLEVLREMHDNDADALKQMIFKLRYRLVVKMANLKAYLSSKYGRLIFRHNLVLDLEGLTTTMLTNSVIRGIARDIISNLTNLFPEMALKIFIINAPAVAVTAYNYVFSLFMDPYTVEKVTILSKSDCQVSESGEPSKLLRMLSRLLEPSMIPKCYGGSADMDVRFGDVPESYERAVDLTHSYPYALPKFKIEGSDKECNLTPTMSSTEKTSTELPTSTEPPTSSQISTTSGIPAATEASLAPTTVTKEGGEGKGDSGNLVFE